jgi:predicted SprT family Zn-dependent metalloprotease
MTVALQLELAFWGRQVGKSATGFPADLPSCLPANSAPDLPTRLYTLGLPATVRVETHANRRVLVSLTSRGALRVHAGYAMAPDDVLLAIACWARPRTRSADRRLAQQTLIAFPVHEHVPPARAPCRVAEPERPGDERLVARLRELHRELNQQHFGGALGEVVLSLSSRMRRRLGEFRPPTSDVPEITISRRHLRRDGWKGVRDTLAHELVHQWQHKTGRKLGHDREFRRRCAAIGIDVRATRRLEHDLP